MSRLTITQCDLVQSHVINVMDCKETGAYLFVNQTSKSEQSHHSVFYGYIRVYYLLAYRRLAQYGATINEEMSVPVVSGDLHCSPTEVHHEVPSSFNGLRHWCSTN